MKNFLLLFSLTVALFSCSGNKEADNQSIQQPTADSSDHAGFFPVTSFLKGQLFLFDSLFVTPIDIVTIKDKTDSQWIKMPELKARLQTFLTPEINDTNLTKFFKETKFNDQTINAITFTYQPKTTLPDSITILYWNVYISLPVAKVTKIYMVRRIKQDSDWITQELTWQTGKYAEIIDISDKPNSDAAVIKREKFVWDPDEE